MLLPVHDSRPCPSKGGNAAAECEFSVWHTTAELGSVSQLRGKCAHRLDGAAKSILSSQVLTSTQLLTLSLFWPLSA